MAPHHQRLATRSPSRIVPRGKYFVTEGLGSNRAIGGCFNVARGPSLSTKRMLPALASLGDTKPIASNTNSAFISNSEFGTPASLPFYPFNAGCNQLLDLGRPFPYENAFGATAQSRFATLLSC